jgi:hypothetical protein
MKAKTVDLICLRQGVIASLQLRPFVNLFVIVPNVPLANWFRV